MNFLNKVFGKKTNTTKSGELESASMRLKAKQISSRTESKRLLNEAKSSARKQSFLFRTGKKIGEGSGRAISNFQKLQKSMPKRKSFAQKPASPMFDSSFYSLGNNSSQKSGGQSRATSLLFDSPKRSFQKKKKSKGTRISVGGRTIIIN